MPNDHMSRPSSPSSPPKCWVYSLLDGGELSQQELSRVKLTDLDSQMVDPLDNLIGFYSVVGAQPLNTRKIVVESS